MSQSSLAHDVGPMPPSSGFLGMPLELRRQIYGLCIPQNLRFDCSWDMYSQNSPERAARWVEPPWRAWRPGRRGRRGGPGTYYSSQETDCSACYGSESSPTDLGDNHKDSMESASSAEATYCWKCQRYRPEVPAHRRSALPGLLLVCRQITDEVETMLYGANTFEIMLHCGGEQDLERFSRERQAKMKRMLVILRPSGSSYNSDFRMNPGIWDSILANLSILEIIAEQPRLANEWQEWTAWLTPILEHLARGLSSEAEIVVDTNRKASTAQLLEAILPGRCRFEKISAADFMFKRGLFFGATTIWPGCLFDDGPMICHEIYDNPHHPFYATQLD